MRNKAVFESDVEETIRRLVVSGRYLSRKDVISEGVRLIAERERRLAGLGSALAREYARVDVPMPAADDIFRRLDAKFATPAEARKG
jgi:antitoxin ParD1/3/4